MHSILTYLLLCPLVGIAGFVDAIAGGGGLISLPAYLIAGIPVHNALGTNKLSSTMGTTVATVRYARSGFIPWQQALLCVLFALAGSSLGAKLALTIPTRTFSILMLVILPLTACYLLRSQGLTQEREPYPSARPCSSVCPSPWCWASTMASTARARAPFCSCC